MHPEGLAAPQDGMTDRFHACLIPTRAGATSRHRPRPPTGSTPLVGVFARHRDEIDSMVTFEKRMQSDDVLNALAVSLKQQLGFAVEEGKKAAGKLNRPVFFGDEGAFLRKYEIDAFHP